MKKIGFLLGMVISFLGLVFIIISAVIVSLPDVDQLKSCMTTKMYNVRLCPNDESYVPLKNISSNLRYSVLISEDASFYSHKGFDLDAIKDSLRTNLKRGHFSRGGSTITQQLVKNVFLNGEKSLMRKALEAVLTIQVEAKYNKNQILEKYLNVVEYGPQIFGIKKAAEFYFAKTPANLSVMESAFLAHLLPNPEKYSRSFLSGKLSKYSRSRVERITSILVKTGKITNEEYSNILGQLDTFSYRPVPQDQIERSALLREQMGEGTAGEVEKEETITEDTLESLDQIGIDSNESSEKL